MHTFSPSQMPLFSQKSTPRRPHFRSTSRRSRVRRGLGGMSHKCPTAHRGVLRVPRMSHRPPTPPNWPLDALSCNLSFTAVSHDQRRRPSPIPLNPRRKPMAGNGFRDAAHLYGGAGHGYCLCSPALHRRELIGLKLRSNMGFDQLSGGQRGDFACFKLVCAPLGP